MFKKLYLFIDSHINAAYTVSLSPAVLNFAQTYFNVEVLNKTLTTLTLFLGLLTAIITLWVKILSLKKAPDPPKDTKE